MQGEYTRATLDTAINRVFINMNNITLHSSNIPVNEWFLDNNTLKTLILMMKDNPNKLWIQHRKLQINDSDIDCFDQQYATLRLNSYASADFNICIWHVSNGYTKIKKLDEEYEDMTAASQLLVKDKKHIVRVYKTSDDNIHILTSKYDWDLARKILALIPKFYPELEKPELTEVLINLATNKLDKAEEIVTKLFDETQLVTNLMDKQFEDLKRALSSSQTYDIEMKIANNRESIQRLNRDIMQIYNSIADLNKELLAIQSQGTAYIDDFINYVRKHRLINIIDVSGGSITLRLITPVRYYDPDVIKRYLNKNIEYITDNKFKNYLLTQLFIDNTIELITYTDVELNLKYNSVEGSRVGEDHMPDRELPVPHPHLMFFNCWGSNKSHIYNSLSDKNYILAVEQIIAATYNWNLTDMTVLRNFMKYISSFRCKNLKTFKVKATGEFKSYEELYKEYREVMNNETD